MSDIGEVFQQMSDAAAKDAPITSREELLKNHTMPDLPCPVCSTLCRADVVLRHKQAISDNAQRPVTPVTDAMVEAGARVMAARRGIKNSDELITTTNSGKVPAWQFYIEEPRAILEAALSSLPSTGLPAPAPHAQPSQLPPENEIRKLIDDFIAPDLDTEKAFASHRRAWVVQCLQAVLRGAPAPHAEVREKTAIWEVVEANVRERLAEGDGHWMTCSGCHDSVDGYDVGYYPHSDVFGCKLGGGCSECGGIGAIWDTTDYAAMGEELSRSTQQDRGGE